ncbi:MAG TPA: copper amine oxidase N-terminal domain-containing protein [Firmicutes bacterium]|nr:copper amine oxidase N-terminal domain-containing protein [Candidatus Fermentithermobacillaceae bacterium]
MKHWMRIAGAAISLTIATASPVLAESGAPDVLAPTAPAEAQVIYARELTLRGVLTYVDLEGGFYSVDGWRLQGDEEQFKPNLGKVVIVTGSVDESPSIYMVKAIIVSSFEVDPDQTLPDKPALEIPPVPDRISVSRAVPGKIAVDGNPVGFDQGPIVSEGILMVPLRFLVEAAGGVVEWDGANQKAITRMPGRIVVFQIGNTAAELVDTGMSITTPMAAAPQLVGGRTLVSADALSLLGFAERTAVEGQPATDDVLDLTLPVPPPVEDISSTLTGVIKEMESGEKVRILVEGGPMASGEPSLTWVTIDPDTKISVEENGQLTDADISALAVGQTVEVVTDGAIAMSYPALAGAAAVVIKK